uniref:Glycine dehydrogenase C-terminal domain-containing protein n=1 Tax=Malurus cyaneus samueli TaxID=2593467 RepID=A0A8C5THE6_9PASS
MIEAKGFFFCLRKYLLSLGQGEEFEENFCLIPKSAHGTNPASAQMAGMEDSANLKWIKNGSIDMFPHLKAMVDKHKGNLAAIMITLPFHQWWFEEGDWKMCNKCTSFTNTEFGLCRPGDMALDVSHLISQNLAFHTEEERLDGYNWELWLFSNIKTIWAPLLDACPLGTVSLTDFSLSPGFHASNHVLASAGTLMIEPTESEDKAEWTIWCDAMISHRSGNRWLVFFSPLAFCEPESKFWPTIARIDDIYGDQHLVCTCPPMEAYESPFSEQKRASSYRRWLLCSLPAYRLSGMEHSALDYPDGDIVMGILCNSFEDISPTFVN